MKSQFLALFPALFASIAVAGPCENTGQPTTQLEAAKLYIENNAGDGDIGVHGYFDDDGWRELCVFNPAGELIMHIAPDQGLGDLGISSVFWESVEPEYAEWDFEALKVAFPEGMYPVRAIGIDGSLRQGAARFTTVVPAMPTILEPETVSEPDEGDVPVLPVATTTVAWTPVTTSLDGRPVRITAYQLTVVREDYEDPHGLSRPIYSVHLDAGTSRHEVPKSFFKPDGLYEVEVLAIEESGNQTIGGASFFRTE